MKGHLEGVVPGDDGAHDTHWLTPDLPGVHLAGQLDHGVAELDVPGVRIDEIGRIRQRISQRQVQLWPVGHHPGTSHFEDEFLAQGLLLAFKCALQLPEALLAKRPVGRPVGLVEGSPGRVNGAMHVS